MTGHSTSNGSPSIPLAKLGSPVRSSLRYNPFAGEVIARIKSIIPNADDEVWLTRYLNGETAQTIVGAVYEVRFLIPSLLRMGLINCIPSYPISFGPPRQITQGVDLSSLPPRLRRKYLSALYGLCYPGPHSQDHSRPPCVTTAPASHGAGVGVETYGKANIRIARLRPKS